MPHSTDHELLDVVDDGDRVVGTATRAEIHARGLLHRAVHVAFFDSNGRVLLQRRSEQKDTYAGFWDISVGGHVDSGEDYLAAAVRECREEMGITLAATQLTRVATLTASPETGWEFIAVFAAQLDGAPRPDPTEISATRWADSVEYHANARPDAADADWRVAPAGRLSILRCLDALAEGLALPQVTAS